MELFAHLAQVEEGEERGGSAAFHVARASTIDLSVHQLATPGIAGPASAVADGKDVDMPIEREMTARLRRIESCNDIRHDLVRRDDAMLDAVLIQQMLDVFHRQPRVARRVGARAADEAAEEVEQPLAIPLDPLHQALFCLVHIGDPPPSLSFPAC